MPKGEGSPRILCLSADALEERLLMSRAGSSPTVHALSTPQVSTLPTASRTEVETDHPGSANVGDLQERDAEMVAAASQAATTASKDQYTIPLVFNTRTIGDSEESSTNTVGALGSSLTLRVSYGEEHVAWGLGVSTSSNVVTMSRNWSKVPLPAPEASLEQLLDAEAVEQPEVKEEVAETLGQAATQRADLLAPLLPFDRVGLEQAIDRLLDGIEDLGERIARDGETAELIPLPIAWGIGLAAVEVVRRRLRPRSDGDDEPDRDPALGLLGSPA